MALQDKIDLLTAQFKVLTTQEALYQKIIECGQELAPFDPQWKCEENRVAGCQSLMYLYTRCENSYLTFFAHSDALISAGLAALLIRIYSDEPPETILLSPPTFLEELKIPSALTPGRANGLLSLYLKMKQEAVRFLLPSN